MTGKLCLLLLAMLFVAQISNAARPEKDRASDPVFLTGLEETNFGPNFVPERGGHYTLDDTMRVGTTWYDLQSNGTLGKQCDVAGGYVHVVWTNGLNSGSGVRHVYYNALDQENQSWISPFGVQIDAASRAGFVTVACSPEGFAFPAFHQVTATLAHAAVAIDYLPASGAFTTSEIPGTEDAEVIWPKIAVDIDTNVHVVATENGGSSLDYYAKGHPLYTDFHEGLDIDWPVGFTEWEPATFITLDVAAGRHSDRVAVAWLNTGGASESVDPTDLFLMVSEDKGETWEDPINITSFALIDTFCVDNGGDPNICNKDTLRPWIDLSLIMDEHDSVHIAFTAHGYFFWDVDGTRLDGGYVYSTLWHWFEGRDEFNIIHEAWYANNYVALGSNNLTVHRPNLAVDTSNGNLYCSFQKFDSLQVSEGGFPSGDAWITASSTGGRTWANAINVSNTVTDSGAVPGDCLSERDVSLAGMVTDGIVHMVYTLDRDCGTAVTTTAEGTPTLNPIYYRPLPVEDIPFRPYVNPYRAFHADSSGFPWDLDTIDIAAGNPPVELPGGFALHQNYPNPFNPTTRIQFDLTHEMRVNLFVYDVTGREVSRVVDGQILNAGVHVVEFDAGSLATGVYFYRLDTGVHGQTRKMMLLR